MTSWKKLLRATKLFHQPVAEAMRKIDTHLPELVPIGPATAREIHQAALRANDLKDLVFDALRKADYALSAEPYWSDRDGFIYWLHLANIGHTWVGIDPFGSHLP